MLAMSMQEEIINMSVDVQEIFEKEVGGTNDYEKLKNIPSLDGVIFKGDMHEKDPTVPEWAKSSKKPEYSADEIGAVSEENEVSLEEISTWF